jgi:hypothetical protein
MNEWRRPFHVDYYIAILAFAQPKTADATELIHDLR